jgi:hypothetical protein
VARLSLILINALQTRLAENTILKKGHLMVEARVDRSWILKFVVTLAALVLLPISTSTQAHAEEEGRIQITFSKPGYGSGSGYLFYQGQKYGLDVSAAKIGRIRVTTIDFIGTASNLRSAGDILGTYNGGDPKAALVRRAMTVRLENARGVVLEIRAVNLNGASTLDLSGMTLKNVGWQPSSE